MGRWRLNCPTGGEFEGECQYKTSEDGTFVLVCPDGVETIIPCKPEEDKQKKKSSRLEDYGTKVAEKRRKLLEEIRSEVPE